MNAITTLKPSAKALAMVASARQNAGATNPVSEGAVMLAEYLVERQTHPLVDFLGGWGGVFRLIADGYMPGNDIGEEMGRLTSGVLTPQMWRRVWAGEFDVAIADDTIVVRQDGLVCTGDLIKQFSETAGRSAAILERLDVPFEMIRRSAPSIGALGTVPAGKLFHFRRVEDKPSVRQVYGLGQCIELGEPELCALRDAANAAIADLRGGAQQ